MQHKVPHRKLREDVVAARNWLSSAYLALWADDLDEARRCLAEAAARLAAMSKDNHDRAL